MRCCITKDCVQIADRLAIVSYLSSSLSLWLYCHNTSFSASVKAWYCVGKPAIIAACCMQRNNCARNRGIRVNYQLSLLFSLCRCSFQVPTRPYFVSDAIIMPSQLYDSAAATAGRNKVIFDEASDERQYSTCVNRCSRQVRSPSLCDVPQSTKVALSVISERSAGRNGAEMTYFVSNVT